ncbi:uncharacterized protein LOC123677940 [Harmonia axyridis]|uniref:uncharacterized protein LOC123677940 n=1 Tax=Harmonia axyridis TaxID=115357 RepID=UPI001E279C8B|nr:uncharacterized protein LOC123677940 [Harmonia axyridis]
MIFLLIQAIQINFAKKEHFSNIIRNSDNRSKASWKVINSLTKSKISSSVSSNQDSPLPDELNDFFIDFPSTLTDGLNKTATTSGERLENSFFMFEVSHEEVLKTCINMAL